MLILYDSKKLSLEVEKYLIDKFLSKKKRLEIIYKKLEYKNKIFLINKTL